MTIKMLVFDYRDTEKKFFEENYFDNFDIKFFDFSLNEETLNKISNEDREHATVISIFVDSLLTDEVINSFKNLRMIATRSTGYDNINKKTCVQRNISVLNVQNYGETAVAEFTMGLIIGLTRNLFQAAASVKDNSYKNKNFVGRDLEQLTLGVIGTGAIGAAVCKLAYAFGMKIFAYDLKAKNELSEKYSVKYLPLEDTIRNSDVISLHLPYTGNNYHMFSKREFELMRQNSYFINVSRGELVEMEYLKQYLINNKISAAALDVVACDYEDKCFALEQRLEITSLDCLENSKIVRELIQMPNVIVTPHMAYNSQDAIDYILKETFDGIRDCINGGNKNRVI